MPLDETRPDIPDDQARWSRGEEDPLRVAGVADEWGHPIQYALVGHPRSTMVVGTTGASDTRIREVAGLLVETPPVERFNRCPTCEQWSPCSVRRAWEVKLLADEPRVEDTLRAAGKLDESERPTFNPDACAHGYTYGQYCDAYGEFGGAVDAAHIAERRVEVDPLADAHNAWIQANHAGHSSPEDGERYLLATQTAAALSGAESLAAVSAAVAAAMPGVLHTLGTVAKTVQDALAAQTAALGRIAEALADPSGMVDVASLVDVEVNDLEAAALAERSTGHFGGWSAPGVTRHDVERLRMRLDRIRELCDVRQVDSVGGGKCDGAEIWPSEIIDILDADPATWRDGDILTHDEVEPHVALWVDGLPDEERARLEWGVQWNVGNSRTDLRCRRFPDRESAETWFAGYSGNLADAKLVAAQPGERWRPVLATGLSVCEAHGAHPHRGMVCLDCPQCPRATRDV
jgi:hypothetical protein